MSTSTPKLSRKMLATIGGAECYRQLQSQACCDKNITTATENLHKRAPMLLDGSCHL